MLETTDRAQVSDSIIKSWFVMMPDDILESMLVFKQKQLLCYEMYDEFATHAEMAKREIGQIKSILTNVIPF